MAVPKSPDSQVAIIGGGPCGLLAGLLLARAGVRCAVFERRGGLSDHPKAMSLTRRTIEIFRHLGLDERIGEEALPLDGRDLAFWGRALAGEELGRVPYPSLNTPHSPCRPAHCPQTHTERVLHDALLAEPAAEVHFNIAVEGIEEAADATRLKLSDGSLVESSWVIAADGAAGSTRHALGIETEGPGDLGHFLNVQFRADYSTRLGDNQALLYHAVGAEFFEFFVAINGRDLWLMHHFLQKGERLNDFPTSRLESIIRQASGLPDVPVEVLGVRPWVMSPKVARSWRSGRVFLCGDAAARLSPAGGLGLNNGMHSVHNLAWKLAEVVAGRAPTTLLDTYEEERRVVSQRLMRSSNRNAEEVFSVVAAASRGDFDEVRDIVSHSRRTDAGLGQDLGICYDRGAFLPDHSRPDVMHDPVNEFTPSAKPGCRAPHAPTKRCNGHSSLLDLFGPGFVALVGTAGGAWHTGAGDIPVLQNGADFHCRDFEPLYGIGSTGAVLVRPDGHVAARFADATPDACLDAARRAVLGR